MSAENAADLLKGFTLLRVLSQDARTKSANLLGKISPSSEQVIVLLEKTHFSNSFLEHLDPGSPSATTSTGALSRFDSLGSNDVYHWLLAWMGNGTSQTDHERTDDDAHVKLTVIRPATEAHIQKYTEQQKIIITESASLYDDVVRPWINQQPVERIQWVYNILEKKKEADTILFEQQATDDANKGFIILPDLKWDRKTLSSLYLVAIVHDRSIKTMRDLSAKHLPLLRSILSHAQRVAYEQFGLKQECKDGKKDDMAFSKVRCFVHYQPTYYHFHVHILSADYTSHPGAIVGQAHLLQDIIDLLELGVDFSKRTLTYALGNRSQLLAHIQQHPSRHAASHADDMVSDDRASKQARLQ